MLLQWTDLSPAERLRLLDATFGTASSDEEDPLLGFGLLVRSPEGVHPSADGMRVVAALLANADPGCGADRRAHG